MRVMCVYATAGGPEEAGRIGRIVVEERLAACANIIDPVQSVFWWQEKIEESKEAALILKTAEDRVAALIARIKELHSYACPCIEAWPIEVANEDFRAWVLRETHAGGAAERLSGVPPRGTVTR